MRAEVNYGNSDQSTCCWPSSLYTLRLLHRWRVARSPQTVPLQTLYIYRKRTLITPHVRRRKYAQGIPNLKRHPMQNCIDKEKLAVVANHTAVGGGMGAGGSCSICRIRKLFSSMNCSSSVRSSRNEGRKRRSLSRLLISIRCTATDLLGFATKTCRI
jgi:hypothetical protein